MPNLSIKHVPEQVVDTLRKRAAANHRSLQGELLALISSAASAGEHADATPAKGGQQRGHKSIEQIAAEHLAQVKRPIRKGGRSVDLIRADRDVR